MLKKSSKHEVWYYVKNGKYVGILARVPELLRLNLISTGPDFAIRNLNKWLYISDSFSITEYNTFEEAKVDLV